MIRIFSCTTPFAIGEIWSNYQVSPKSIAYMKHSDRLCPGLGGHGGGGRESEDDDSIIPVTSSESEKEGGPFHKHSFSPVRQYVCVPGTNFMNCNGLIIYTFIFHGV